MSAIGDVVVNIRSQVQDLKAGISESIGSVKDLGTSMQNTGKAVSGTGKTLSKTVTGPIAAGVGIFTGLAKSVSSSGVEIGKMAAQSGVGVEAYQEMHHWASENNIASGDMNRALGRLNQRIGLAKEGNDKYSGALENLGVNMEKVNDGTMTTDEAMTQAISSLSEMDNATEQSAAASELFGTKLARTLLPALQDGSMSLEEAKQQAQELGIIMDEDAIAASEKFDASWSQLTNTIKGAFLPLAVETIDFFNNSLFPTIQERVIPAIQDFGEFVSQLAAQFNGLSPATQDLILMIVGLVAALGPVLVIVGKVITLAGTLTLGIGKVGGAFTLLLNPIGLVIGIIAALVAGFLYLWNTNEDFRNAVTAIWDSIWSKAQEIFSYIADFIMDIWSVIQSETEVIWSLISDIIDQAMQSIEKIIQFVTEAAAYVWENWGENLVSIAQGFWDLITNLIENAIKLVSNIIQLVLNIIRGDWSAAFENLLSIGEAIFDSIIAVIDWAVNHFLNLIQIGLGLISDLWDSTFGKWLGIAVDIFDSIVSTIGNKIDEAYAVVSAVLSTILSFFSDIFSDLGSTVSDGMTDVVSFVSDGIENALDTVTSWGSKFLEAGANIVGSIADGISGAVGKVTGAIDDVVGSVRDFLPFSPAKEGPLQDIHRLNFAGPITDSIDNDLGDIQKSMYSMLDVADVNGSLSVDHDIDSVDSDSGGSNDPEGSGDEYVVEIPVTVDGREVARGSARFMDRELRERRNRKSRAEGKD